MRYFVVHRTRGKTARHIKREVSGFDEMLKELRYTKNFYTNVTMVGIHVLADGDIMLYRLADSNTLEPV